MTHNAEIDPIAQFYEAHPYPPPVEALSPRSSPNRTEHQRWEHHLLWPARPFSQRRSVLIAGCGTSQAARYAMANPRASVMAIDVSEASLRHTMALAERHDLDNLTVRRLAVEDASKLEGPFDHVVCTGVIHHLAAPDRGLAALADVLAPGGALHLMVYAPFGRTGIDMIRRYGQLLGLTTSESDIDDLLASLQELPSGHPLAHLLGNSPDFDDRHALADALLNPREQSYSVPQLFRLLDGAGLAFGRWLRQAPYLPHCGVLAGLAHGERIAALEPADQYAAVELFRGTMTRHSVIANHRADVPAASPVDFDGPGPSAWLDYVPLRSPTALDVDDRERLPPGAAAALLNRAHTHTDLVLFVDSAGHAIFRGIDGQRSIGAIVEQADDVSIAVAHGLFRQLWRHDLVVFDTRGATD
ncbi:MAG: class I SAM-dependent methyltransferase [Acidimicrobiales bacterium]